MNIKMRSSKWLSYWAITVFLVTFFTLGPAARAVDQPPKENNTIVMGCLVVVIGGIFTYGVYKLCQKVPSGDPPNPPPAIVTNMPITRVNWTNVFGPGWVGNYPPPGYVSPRGMYQSEMPALNGAAHDSNASRAVYALPAPIPFDSTQWEASPESSPNPPAITKGAFTHWWSLRFESSTNLTDWRTRCDIYGFESMTNGILCELLNVYRGSYDAVTNTVPIFSGFRTFTDPLHQELYIPQDAFRVDMDSAKEFFRFAQSVP